MTPRTTRAIITAPLRIGRIVSVLLGLLLISQPTEASVASLDEKTQLVTRGRYLAGIGVCSACHTAPHISATSPTTAAERAADRTLRSEPNWYEYLDPDGSNYLSGGVPFILRLGANASGLVVTTNITPDPDDGLGNWTEQEIADTIRSGKRPKSALTGAKAGKPYLYLFPPHSFYQNLAESDALALAYYLKSIPPKKSPIPIPPRELPPEFEPSADSDPFGPVSTVIEAPQGRTRERAIYLTRSLVGCRECHSHHSQDPALTPFSPEHASIMEIFRGGPDAIRGFKTKHEWDPAEPFLGPLIPFAGGGPGDPYEGAFRLGPDLPLRIGEKGAALFPYPGYAVLYGPNLTGFGHNGPLNYVSSADIVRAVRQGIGVAPDRYGRPRQLSQVMMWPFYSSMNDDDAFAIAEYLKSLDYIPSWAPALTLYGEDWAGMLQQIFGGPPTPNDHRIFGKP